MFPKKEIIRDKKLVKEYFELYPYCQIGKGCEFFLDPPHHIVFKSQGGGDEHNNLITLCRKHHDHAHGKRFPKITKKQLRKIKEAT